MSLQARAIRAFDEAVATLADAGASALLGLLVTARDSLSTPMRVAVVGRVKAGKSTLMNALLEGQVAATGPEELTFNVTWFVHAASPGLTVHFKDRRPPEPRPMAWLGRLVDRSSEDVELLRSIRHVEVGLPRAILNRLQLIDTPGFGSFFDADSRNTLEFLGLSTDQIDGLTREHAVGADAVLYLFARGVAATDRQLVEDFQGSAIGDFTPVNAIAVLTKCDAYWSTDEPDVDPLDTGATISDRIVREPGVDRIFFTVLPICGLLAAGATSLSHEQLAVLVELAELPFETLRRRLRYADRFATATYEDVPVPPAERAAVLDRVGQYGIWLACGFIRECGADPAALERYLLDRSGVPRLQALLLSHFGNRASVIKAASAVNSGRVAAARLSREAEGVTAAAAASAAGRLEEFELDEIGIAELALLRLLYRDDSRLGLSKVEVEELLAVTGEQGSFCAARLGRPSSATPDELLDVVTERLTYWRRRADEFGLSSQTAHAVRGVQRSYEQISHHLRAAKRHLEMDA